MNPPPGYVAYGNAPTPFQALRRVGRLSTAVVVLTIIGAVGTVVTAALTATVRQDARDFLSGATSEAQFRSAIGPLSAAQSLSVVATLATFVLTVIWMYRLASNVRAFQRRTTWHPLFAIFGWMLPPLLYIIPFLMLRELWRASDPTNADDTEGWRGSANNPVTWVWFVLYGIAPIVLLVFSARSTFSGLSSQNLESLANTLDNFSFAAMLSTVLSVAAAAAWIVLVRQLTARHIALTNER
jgi:hypothetical protein